MQPAARAGEVRRQLRGRGRDRFVARRVEMANDLAAAPFVEQPVAEARRLDRAHARQVDATHLERLQCARRVVGSGDRHHADVRAPQSSAECFVQHRTARLRAAAATVGVDDVVDHEIADAHEIGSGRCHPLAPREPRHEVTRSITSGRFSTGFGIAGLPRRVDAERPVHRVPRAARFGARRARCRARSRSA